jgi:hypothetical protein
MAARKAESARIFTLSFRDESAGAFALSLDFGSSLPDESTEAFEVSLRDESTGVPDWAREGRTDREASNKKTTVFM